MKTPQEFKQSVYRKKAKAAAAQRKKALVIGITVPTCAAALCMGVAVFHQDSSPTLYNADNSVCSTAQTTGEKDSITTVSTSPGAILLSSSISNGFSASAEADPDALESPPLDNCSIHITVAIYDTSGAESTLLQLTDPVVCDQIISLLKKLDGKAVSTPQSARIKIILYSETSGEQFVMLSDSAFCLPDGTWRLADSAVLSRLRSLLQSNAASK